jgi:hypothetical protein
MTETNERFEVLKSDLAAECTQLEDQVRQMDSVNDILHESIRLLEVALKAANEQNSSWSKSYCELQKKIQTLPWDITDENITKAIKEIWHVSENQSDPIDIEVAEQKAFLGMFLNKGTITEERARKTAEEIVSYCRTISQFSSREAYAKDIAEIILRNMAVKVEPKKLLWISIGNYYLCSDVGGSRMGIVMEPDKSWTVFVVTPKGYWRKEGFVNTSEAKSAAESALRELMGAEAKPKYRYYFTQEGSDQAVYRFGKTEDRKNYVGCEYIRLSDPYWRPTMGLEVHRSLLQKSESEALSIIKGWEESKQ